MANRTADTARNVTVEYHSENVHVTDALKAKVEKRLQRLSGGHRDISGASVAVHVETGANRHQEYQARVVVYRKPSNVAATTKGDSVSGVVQDALDAVARQTRRQRERMRERSRSHRESPE